MSIFNNGDLIKDNKKKMDEQLTDYCKSIGIQKQNICEPIIKNCIQNVNDPDLFDQEKFKFDNQTEIENERKCAMSWGENKKNQQNNIVQSYNLKFLEKPNAINIKNLYNNSFNPEDWINKLVPNYIKKEILNHLAPYTEKSKKIRSNRINNYNKENLFIFSKDFINEIKNCENNYNIGKFYLTINNDNKDILIKFFKKDNNNINYQNLKKNIENFMNIYDININKLTINDLFILIYTKMNESLPYSSINTLNITKKILISFIIKRFIQIFCSVNDIQLLNSVDEWCLYVDKNETINNISIFNSINEKKYKGEDGDIYLGFTIDDINIVRRRLNIYLNIYNYLFRIDINNEIYKKIQDKIKEYSNKYSKLLCKIFKLTNEDYIYNIFFYIVKKIIFEEKNKQYSEFLYYIFINYCNINEHLNNDDLIKIKDSIELIAQNAKYKLYDDIINLDKNTIKKYYNEPKPLKLITKEMFERLINNIRQINNKEEYQINTSNIENAIKKIIKDVLLVNENALASEIDIYEKLNTIQVELPIEKAAIYDIRFILRNLPLFKEDLQKQKIKEYSCIYPIERVYNYYCDNVEKNNLSDVNQYFAKSMKLVNGKPIMTTTYDDLLYLFNFFNEYNRRKQGMPIIKNSQLTDNQFILNLQSELNRIKTRKNIPNIYNFNTNFSKINELFYTYLMKIIRNKNFEEFSNQIINVVQNY